MAINPANGVLDITNGIIRVSSIDVRDATGFNTAINNVARNTILLYDDQESTTNFIPQSTNDYQSTTGVTRDTTNKYIELNSASDDGWIYWPLKLPNAWKAEFDMNITASGGLFTFTFFNTSTPNHSNDLSNDGGYKIIFDNTNNNIIFRLQGVSKSTTSVNLRSNDWQHVNINYYYGQTSVSIDGKIVASYRFTEDQHETNHRYVGFSAKTGTIHKIRKIIINNADKWTFTDDSNASDICYLNGNVGIGTTTTDHLLDVHGNAYISENLTIQGNLNVLGTTTMVQIEDLQVENAIIELGNNNVSDTIDLGIVMNRPTSNVVIGFRGDESELAIGYTHSDPSGSHIVPIADGALKTTIYGNLHSNNVTTGGLTVDDGFSMGSHILPTTNDTYDIGSAEYKIRDLYVADNSLWVGDEAKIAFSNGELKFRKRKTDTVPAAVTAAGGHATGAKAFAGVSNLTDIKAYHWLKYMRTLSGQSNAKMSDVFRDHDADYETTSTSSAWSDVGDHMHTVQSVAIGKTTAPTAPLDVAGAGVFSGNITTTGNIGVNKTNPTADVHVVGYQHINDAPTHANSFDHTTAPLTLTNSTVTSTTAVNDPSPVLHLTREGTSSQSYGARATMDLCRWENNGTNSRSRLDFQLAEGTYANTHVMSLRSDGRVGIGVTNPAHKLDVDGDINLSTGSTLRINGTPAVFSNWTVSGSDIYRSSGNVGIGTTSPAYKLDVHGSANVGTLTATTISGPVSGNASTATALATARTIGGVSFDGTADITLPGVNAPGTQNTAGNAATATALATVRTIGGVSFDGTANIDLPGVNTSGTQNTAGNAATATTATNQSGGTVNATTITGTSISLADNIVHTGDTSTSFGFPGTGTIDFFTAGSERMRITSSGTVGIGTTSPRWGFEATPTGGLGGVLSCSNDPIFSHNLYYSGGWKYGTANTGGAYMRMIDSEIQFWNAPNSGSGTWDTAGGTATTTQRMTIDESGNVGIGTGSPDTQLHIGPKDDNHIYLASSNNNYGWILDTEDQSNGDVPFRIIKRTGAVDSNVLTIKNQDGNVGIGGIVAESKLHIYALENLLMFQSQRSPYPKMSFDWSGVNSENFTLWDHHSNQRAYLYGRKYTTGTNANSLAGWTFYGNNTTTGLRIDGSANVGIGTDSPDEKLHVNGNVKIGGVTTQLSWNNSQRLIMKYDNHYRQGIHFEASSRLMRLFSTTNDSGGAIVFQTRGGTGSSDTDYGSERMRITSNGNVGIGVSPAVKFHVEGDPAFDGSTTFRMRCNASYYGRNQLQLIGRYEGNNDAWSATGPRNALRFLYQTSSGSSYTDAWTIQSFPNAGNNDLGFMGGTNSTPIVMFRGNNRRVGIGTTSPDERLHVFNNSTTARIIIERDTNSGECNLTLKAYHSSGSTEWQIYQAGSNSHLYFWRQGNRGYLNWGAGNSQLNFTGQHRTFIKDVPFTQAPDLEGLIVSADQNKYIKMSGGIEVGSNAITTNESLPIVTISAKSKDKKCFGVISASEDPETREEVYGNFVSISEKEYGDTRVYINSVGEGAIWVTNINGNLESGDYITTSNVAGYGMKQDSEFLANYTVAKITMDCDFEPVTQPVQQIVKELSNVNYWVKTTYKDVAFERYSNLTEENRQTITTTWYSNEEGEISPGEYSNLESNVQATYSEIETTTYQQIERKESKTEKDGYTLEVREELVNVLDEHGQLQWKDHPTDTEKAYKIRYLTSDGTRTDEANAVHIAAFVGCTYHCG